MKRKLSENYSPVEQPPQHHELVFQQYCFDTRIGGSISQRPYLSSGFYHSHMENKTLAWEIARGVDEAAEVLREG